MSNAEVALTVKTPSIILRSDVSAILPEIAAIEETDSCYLLSVLFREDIDPHILIDRSAIRTHGDADNFFIRLLQERGIPTAIFFNKMDLPGADRKGLLQQLTDTLGEGFADWYGDPAERAEAAAVLDEEVLERYLREGSLLDSDFCRLFRRGTFHPCCFGSALQGEGIDELLGMLGKLLDDQTADIIPADACGEKAERKSAEESFGAYCYKVLYN